MRSPHIGQSLSSGVICIACLIAGVVAHWLLLIKVHMVALIALIVVGILLTVVAVVSMAGGLHWSNAVFGKWHERIFSVERRLQV